MKSSIFLSCSATLMAHNWLRSPLGFGGSKAYTQVPCENKVATYQPYTIQEQASVQTVDITWTDNHAGNHFVRMLPLDDTSEASLTTAIGQLETAPKLFDAAGEGPYQLEIPAGPGNYLAQYGWANYRNCFEIYVTEKPAPLNDAGLAALSNNTAQDCYVALFDGKCGTNGGVYKISEAWYTGHTGGAFGDKHGGAGSCGRLFENWLQRSGGHSTYADSLKNKEDLGDRATYYSDYDCVAEGWSSTGATGDVDCNSYCTDFMVHCNETVVPDHYFSSKKACMAACVTYPNLQTPNETYTGNSLQCRAHHLHVEKADSEEHCKHASLEGGGICEGGDDFRQGLTIDITLAEDNPADATAVAEKFKELLGDIVDPSAFEVHHLEDGRVSVSVLVSFNPDVSGFSPDDAVTIIKQENFAAKLQDMEGVATAELVELDGSIEIPTSSAKFLGACSAFSLCAVFFSMVF